MFKHILSSVVAASSLAITTPALAGVGPPFPASGEDESQQRGDTAEQKTSGQISAEAPTEGERVPAAYEVTGAPTGQEEPSSFGLTGPELSTFGGG